MNDEINDLADNFFSGCSISISPCSLALHSHFKYCDSVEKSE